MRLRREVSEFAALIGVEIRTYSGSPVSIGTSPHWGFYVQGVIFAHRAMDARSLHHEIAHYVVAIHRMPRKFRRLNFGLDELRRNGRAMKIEAETCDLQLAIEEHCGHSLAFRRETWWFLNHGSDESEAGRYFVDLERGRKLLAKYVPRAVSQPTRPQGTESA